MQQQQQEQSWWRSPVGIVTFGFLVVVGFFVLTEHTAHVFGALPWLLLLAACPLMHVFMHHGHHGGRDRSAGSGRPGSEPGAKP